MRKLNLLVIALATFLCLGITTVNAETYSETFLKIFKNGQYKLNSVPIKNEFDMDVYFYGDLYTKMDKLGLVDYTVQSSECNAQYTSCIVTITMLEKKGDAYEEVFRESHRIELIYNYDEKILNEIQKYLEIARSGATLTDDGNWVKLYSLTDLNLINYYSSLTSKEEINDYNNSINYITSLRKEFDNTNVSYLIDTRAGDDIPMQSYSFGYFVAYYNDVAYGYVDLIGTKRNNVLYVPSDTENTTNAYITAAKKRLKEYLGTDIKVEVADLRSNFPINGYEWTGLGDESLMGDYYYSFEINGIDYNFVIIRDSSKMQSIEYLSRDIKTNVSVGTEKNIPLDTHIAVNEIENNSEYKEKLGKNNLYTVNISLNSPSTNKKITKLDNGKFRVAIPIPNHLTGKDLIVEYIADDGSIERHEVTIKDGIAYFETDHFSVYSLGAQENNKIENPETFDEIGNYIVLGTISLIGIVVLYNKKKQFN